MSIIVTTYSNNDQGPGSGRKLTVSPDSPADFWQFEYTPPKHKPVNFPPPKGGPPAEPPACCVHVPDPPPVADVAIPGTLALVGAMLLVLMVKRSRAV